MAALIKDWAHFVVAGRLYIILGTVILLAVALTTGRAVPFDNTTERYFVTGDPNLLAFESLLDLFGDNEYVIVGVEAAPGAADVFEPEALRAVALLTEFFDYHRYITQVRSITNYQHTHADGDVLSTDYLLDDPDSVLSDPAQLDQVKSILAGEELAMGTLISEDFRHTRITARVEYRRDTAVHKIELMRELYALIEEENLDSGDYLLHLSGQPLLNERFEILAEEDLRILIPMMASLMLVMLFVSFRSITATLLPWAVIAAGVLLLEEIQSYLGFPHTTVDRALVPTMIIIGIGVSVHVLVEFYHFRNRGENAPEAARSCIIALWRPALFTAITTSAGFLALSATRIVPVQEFAVMGAIGPLLLFLFALTLLPALLSYVDRVPERTSRTIESGIITRLTAAVPAFTLEHRNTILVLGVASLVFAVVSVPTIRVDTNFVNFFKQNNITRQDVEYFDRTFRGVMTIDLIFDSGADDGIYEPEFLQRVDEFQGWLESREAVGEVVSLTDYLKQINQAMNRDDPAFYRLPDSAAMSAQFLLIYDSSGANEDLSDVKDFNNRYLRINAPVVNMPASEMDRELALMERELARGYSDLNVLLTGGMVMFNAQDQYTSDGMFRSFIIALAVISLLFIILFRSFKYGVLSIIPSILPILITGGIIGLSGVYLDISTMVVGAMTMGLAVDDAIHVMNRYLASKKQGCTTSESIGRAMRESGRAVVFTSLILVLGFGVLTFASFVPIILVGLFGSIIMLLALTGDLIFLPTILHAIDGGHDEPAVAAPGLRPALDDKPD
ncbi:MAG: MMPL family transporter [Pseudohongiellaceae bacterium]